MRLERLLDSTSHRFRFLGVIGLATAWTAIMLSTVPARAKRIDTRPAGVVAEPARHFSFVRFYEPGAGGSIPFGPPTGVKLDRQYAADLRTHVPTKSVDIMMSQCFGGGFLDNLDGTAPLDKVGIGKDHSFASAAQFDQVAISADGVQFMLEQPGPIPYLTGSLDNLSRAWRDEAREYTSGMEQYFRSAAFGRVLSPPNNSIIRDPYAPGGAKQTAVCFEYPTYNSASKAADTRVLTSRRQYAILVVWDQKNNRHDANIVRMYRMLRDKYGVPVANIVVLNSRKSRTVNNQTSTYIPECRDLRPPDPGQATAANLASVFNDGEITDANWTSALAGNMFQGRAIEAEDQLFIYNTGHGNHLQVVIDKDAPGGRRIEIPKPTNSGCGGADAEAAVSVTGIEERVDVPVGWMLLQIAATQPLNGVSFELLGSGEPPVDLGTVGPAPLDEIYTVATLARVFAPATPDDDNLYHYQIPIEAAALDAAPDPWTFEFLGISPGASIVTVGVIGGDQEFQALVPQNDSCANAMPVVEGSYPFDTTTATTDGPAACAAIGADRWYCYTAAKTGSATVSVCGASFDTALAAYAGCGCPAGSPLACNDNACGLASSITFPVVAGGQYLIQLGGAGGAAGFGDLVIQSNTPDLIIGALSTITRHGTVGDVTGYSAGLALCNRGREPVDFHGTTAAHPAHTLNMFRLRNGRFEQLGQAWAMHEFLALQQNLCDTCGPSGGGDFLGAGCSSTTSAGVAGSQTVLGPRSEINPLSGAFPFPHGGTGMTGNAIYKRLQVRNADLDPAQNLGALYFTECRLVSVDDANSGNIANNSSYRRTTVGAFIGGGYNLGLADSTVQGEPAILAWPLLDPAADIRVVDVPGDGRFYVGFSATDNGDGTWHYEYAVYNACSNRAAQALTVPIGGATLSGVGFHDVDYHSGEPFSGLDWTTTVDSQATAWATDVYAQNPNANALRWGTLYNFRFDANRPPTMGVLTLTLFQPGAPAAVEVPVVAVPEAPHMTADMNCDGSVDFFDIDGFMLALLAPVDYEVQYPNCERYEADTNGDGIVDFFDIDPFLECLFVGCP